MGYSSLYGVWEITYFFAMLPSLFDLVKARAESSIAIVVSPLAALMLEQSSRSAFTRVGFKCKFLGDLQSDEGSYRRIVNGKYQLVILSPENLFFNSSLRDMLLSPTYQDRLVALWLTRHTA